MPVSQYGQAVVMLTLSSIKTEFLEETWVSYHRPGLPGFELTSFVPRLLNDYDTEWRLQAYWPLELECSRLPDIKRRANLQTS